MPQHNNNSGTYAKVLLIGSKESGKTQLLNNIVNGLFSASYQATIGVEFATKTSGNIKLQFWDTAGDDRYKAISTSYSDKAKIVIYCLDLSSRTNIKSISKNLVNLKKYCEIGPDKAQLILVGTKSDLDQEISSDELNNIVNNPEYGFAKTFFRTSAKSNRHIESLVTHLLCEISNVDIKNLPPIEQALTKLTDNSILYEKINILKEKIKSLPEQNKELIGQASLEFATSIQEAVSLDAYETAIERFETKCTPLVNKANPELSGVIHGIIIAAMVIALTTIVGFGIGFAAGAWTGPGAFISGVLAGGIAANSVIASSSIFGTGLGIFSGIRHCQLIKNDNSLISDVCDQARSAQYAYCHNFF